MSETTDPCTPDLSSCDLLVGFAAAYDKAQHDAAMHRFLEGTPHLSMAEAFTVLDRYRSMSPLSSA